MKTKNIVFIARSLDGYIADKHGELDWLHSIPNPQQDDMGFGQLMHEVDAVVMGRTTYETVCGFGGEWPYSKHVFVLSTTLTKVLDGLEDKVTLMQGSPQAVLDTIHDRGYYKLYIDGGSTIQGFMREGLIDDLIITTIPILLGGGFPLFGDLDEPIPFEHVDSRLFLGQVVQNHYKRKET